VKYHCWYLGHAWGRWEADLRQFSQFHHDYVDHFVKRWRYCERCGKKQSETYFVPGVSPSRLGYYDLVRKLEDLSEKVIAHFKGMPYEEMIKSDKNNVLSTAMFAQCDLLDLKRSKPRDAAREPSEGK
jgi:hypothetical protein